MCLCTHIVQIIPVKLKLVLCMQVLQERQVVFLLNNDIIRGFKVRA